MSYRDGRELTVTEAVVDKTEEYSIACLRTYGGKTWILVTVDNKAFSLYACADGVSRLTSCFRLGELRVPDDGNPKRMGVFGQFHLYKTGHNENGPTFAAIAATRIEHVGIKKFRTGPIIYVNNVAIRPPRGNKFKILGPQNINHNLLIFSREIKDGELVWSDVLLYNFQEDKWIEEYDCISDAKLTERRDHFDVVLKAIKQGDNWYLLYYCAPDNEFYLHPIGLVPGAEYIAVKPGDNPNAIVTSTDGSKYKVSIWPDGTLCNRI
jgi:hypothetical protein